MSSKERVYYVYNEATGENVVRKYSMSEAFMEAKKRNKIRENPIFKVKGSWILHKT